MSEVPSILDLMDDPAVFGPWFRGKSWDAWRAFLALLFGIVRDEAQDLQCLAATGRSEFPDAPFREAWVCCGRRAGKSLIAALIATYLAFFHDCAAYLAPGELGVVMIVAADTKQAKIILRYVRGFVSSIGMLRKMVVRDTQDAIELSNRISLEVHAASYKTTRGYTLVAAVNDEIAFWESSEDSAEPDREVLAAQRPALSTVPTAVQLNLSSPYGRSGCLFDAYEKHFAREDSRVLFWKAPSRALPEQNESVEMNPSISLATVEEAYRDDPVAASSEYGAEFRNDLEKLFSLVTLERITDRARPEILPPVFDEVTP